MPTMKIPGPVAAKGLYRKLLRSHAKYLPTEMRLLGDHYVKSEFRLHTKVTKHDTLDMFYTEWLGYLNALERAARTREAAQAGNLGGANPFQIGSNIPTGFEFNDEQKAQLELLKEEAQKLCKKK